MRSILEIAPAAEGVRQGAAVDVLKFAAQRDTVR
jgi:hypothetical protein